MLKRVAYSLGMAWRYRHSLAHTYYSTPKAHSSLDVCPATLKAEGVRLLVLDFDGVLAADRALSPLPAMRDWLQRCLEHFPIENIIILSNQPHPARLARIATEFPGLRCITGVRKKPYPDGLLSILQQSNIPAEQTVLVDDRLLTGVLAAYIAGVRPVYITKPWADYRQNFRRELFFGSLRWLERRSCRLLFRRAPIVQPLLPKPEHAQAIAEMINNAAANDQPLLKTEKIN